MLELMVYKIRLIKVEIMLGDMKGVLVPLLMMFLMRWVMKIIIVHLRLWRSV
jgi:hypothetical protein